MPDRQVITPPRNARADFLAASGIIALWAITRMLMLRIFTLPNSNYIVGDVNYYKWWLTSSQLPVSQILQEYPVPVIWGMKLLVWASGGQGATYFLPLFAVTMMTLDAVMTLALWRAGHRFGTVWWVLFVFALGPIMWFRFDMVPAVCMGLATLWYRRHPAACGAAIAVGASIKLWPALLILPMIGRNRPATRRLVSFAVTGGFLALASLVTTSWSRLVSPLTWQSDRGLQIESVPASIPMIQRLFESAGEHVVAMSRFNAYEITGPGVSLWTALSSLLMAVAVGVAVILGVTSWQRDGLSHRTVALASTVIIGALIVSNKTLSPQYFVWWGAAMAVLLDGFSGEPEAPEASLIRVRWTGAVAAGALFLTGVLTQCVYPLSYGHVIGTPPQGWAISLLVARNAMALLTVAVAGIALRRSLADTRPLPEPVADTLPEKIGNAARSL
ncbi:MAG: glycosyltransferase family 87 protein [Acidipropionibacterium acidipropionici]|uniref:glycosyltransferase family 87 protein n=1 Tax=Acidipropionibacterium acidipropionici TaxID=1748 RepID=UPI002F351705